MEFDDEYVPVPTYEDDDTTEEEEQEVLDETQVLPVKIRKKRQWIYKETFDCNQDAQDWLAENKLWGYLKTSELEGSKKVEYRCNQVKRRGKQCARAMCFMYPADNLTVIRQETSAEHDHDEINEISKRIGIDEHTKEKILQYLALGITIPKTFFQI